MMFLGIDQYARQLTISLRDESGDVIQARQVSTQPEKVQAFLAALTRDCEAALNYRVTSFVDYYNAPSWVIAYLAT